MTRDLPVFKFGRSESKALMLSVAANRFGKGEFRRIALLKATEAHLRLTGRWPAGADEPHPTSGNKWSKGRVYFDYTFSHLVEDGAYQKLDKYAFWRLK